LRTERRSFKESKNADKKDGNKKKRLGTSELTLE